MKNYEVIILKPGYCHRLGPTKMRADGTVTLIKGPKNIIVDTGGPQDSEHIIDALSKEGLSPRDISHVICTHGHSDHVGNNNLFWDAAFIVSHDISKGDLYTFHDFKSGESYMIDEEVEVIPTPGHTSQDISVIVRIKEGVVAITGDLFESEQDLVDEELWRASSELPVEQEKSRAMILAIADTVVPGHGEMFKVKKS
ncbi:MAG: MBL fold metallo-hydrolase [Deltaproteobacteria bacterium]|nr:MBL fold metallo-hydrolase [Deltaproteobacteria bacterium]